MTAFNQTVVNLSTGKQVQRKVFGITVTLSEKAGQVKVNRRVKMVYFSSVTGRWCF